MNEELREKINKMNNLVELHLHLDGALSINNCKKLAKIQNIDIPKDDKVIRNMIMVPSGCHDLNEFLTKFEFSVSLLQTAEGIKNAIKNLQEELIEQGIIYAEIRFAPQKSCERGLNQRQAVEAVLDGMSRSPIPSSAVKSAVNMSGSERIIGYAADISILRYAMMSPMQ